MNKNLRTIIIGAGGQAGIIKDIFELNGQNFIGYVSSEPKGNNINGYPILCSIDDLANEYIKFGIEAAIISIGDNYIRYKIYNVIQKINIKFINAIHPSAIISKSALLGNGILVNAGAVIQANSKIGNHTTIGTLSSIDHDCKVGNFVNIAPHAGLCGNVRVEDGVVVGPNSIILEKVSLLENSLVAAGSTVISNVQKGTVVAGTPANFLKKRIVSKSYLK